MAEGKQKHDWDMAALLWQVQANACRDVKAQRKPFLPSMVHPYRGDSYYQPVEGDISEFRALFEVRQNGQRN